MKHNMLKIHLKESGFLSLRRNHFTFSTQSFFHSIIRNQPQISQVENTMSIVLGLYDLEKCACQAGLATSLMGRDMEKCLVCRSTSRGSLSKQIHVHISDVLTKEWRTWGDLRLYTRRDKHAKQLIRHRNL